MSSTIDSRARLRHYLEQMMVAFVMSDVDVAEAADHLAEIESHCIESGEDEPADPFELFGEPTDLALQMVPPPKLSEYLLHASWVGVLNLFSIAIISIILRLAGVEAVSRPAALAAIAFVGGSTALALGLTRPPRSAELGGKSAKSGPILLAAAIVTALTVFAGLWVWTRYGSGEVPVHLGLWLFVLVVVVPFVIAILVKVTRLRGPFESPQPVGITADIIEDMQNSKLGAGWVKYGMDGESLDDMSAKDTARWLAGEAKGAYRSIRSALDGDPPGDRSDSDAG